MSGTQFLRYSVIYTNTYTRLTSTQIDKKAKNNIPLAEFRKILQHVPYTCKFVQKHKCNLLLSLSKSGGAIYQPQDRRLRLFQGRLCNTAIFPVEYNKQINYSEKTKLLKYQLEPNYRHKYNSKACYNMRVGRKVIPHRQTIIQLLGVGVLV